MEKWTVSAATKFLLAFGLLVGLAWAQTHTEVTLEDTQTITGPKTINGFPFSLDGSTVYVNTGMSSAAIASAINGLTNGGVVYFLGSKSSYSCPPFPPSNVTYTTMAPYGNSTVSALGFSGVSGVDNQVTFACPSGWSGTTQSSKLQGGITIDFQNNGTGVTLTASQFNDWDDFALVNCGNTTTPCLQVLGSQSSGGSPIDNSALNRFEHYQINPNMSGGQYAVAVYISGSTAHGGSSATDNVFNHGIIAGNAVCGFEFEANSDSNVVRDTQLFEYEATGSAPFCFNLTNPSTDIDADGETIENFFLTGTVQYAWNAGQSSANKISFSNIAYNTAGNIAGGAPLISVYQDNIDTGFGPDIYENGRLAIAANAGIMPPLGNSVIFKAGDGMFARTSNSGCMFLGSPGTGPMVCAGSGAPSLNCVKGSQYYRIDGSGSSLSYTCTSTNTWAASAFAFPVTIPTGLGAVSQLVFPSDQAGQIATQNNQNLNLSPNGTGFIVPGSKIQFPTGLGAISQLVFPSDQPGEISSQNSQNLVEVPGGSTPTNYSPSTKTTTITASSFVTCGPGPWIDVTCYGAKGDGLFSKNGQTSTTSGTTTVTISGSTAFAATDCTGGSGCTGTVNKLIAINGTATTGGLAVPTAGTIAFSSAGSLTLHNACLVITAIQDNQSLPVTTGGPSINGESEGTTEVCAGGAITSKEVTMTAPTLPANATGYRVYFTDESGTFAEVSQIVPGTAYAGCATQSAQNVRDGACDPSAGLTINAITYIGFYPPFFNSWLSTIKTFVSTTQVTVTDGIPSDVTSNEVVAWGTPNDTAYTNALTACPNNGGSAILYDNGCTLFFPPTKTQSSPANFTGRYASQNGLVILQPAVVVKMPGALSALPNSGNAPPIWTNWGTESLWTMGRAWGLQFGNQGTHISGGGTEQAMANDMGGVGYGGMFNAGTIATTDHLKVNHFYAMNYLSGPCIAIGNVQIANYSDSGGLCLEGIDGQDFSSNNQFNDIEVVGTNIVESSAVGPAWGMRFASNPAVSGSITGNNQVHMAKIRDFWQGMYRFKNASNNSVFQGKAENINLSGFASCPGGGTACSGAAIQMDDVTDSGRCGQNAVIGGSYVRMAFIYNIGANCTQDDVIELNPQQIPAANDATACVDNGSASDIIMGNGLASYCPNKLNGVLFGFPGSSKLSADSSGITATTAATATTIFTLSNLAVSQQYTFHCSGSTTQATAGGGIGIAIKANTTAATNMEAHATVATSLTAVNAGATQLTSGNVANTTATTIYASTSGTLTTQLPFTIDGSIETGTTAPSSVTIGFYSASASDAVVVKRDSYCTIGL